MGANWAARSASIEIGRARGTVPARSSAMASRTRPTVKLRKPTIWTAMPCSGLSTAYVSRAAPSVALTSEVSVTCHASEAKAKAPMANAIPPRVVSTAPMVARVAPRERARPQTAMPTVTPTTAKAKPSSRRPAQTLSRIGARLA